MARSIDLLAKAKTPSGVKEYEFLALSRKEAMKVYHESLSSIAQVVSKAVQSLQIDRGNLGKSKIDLGAGAGGLLSGVAGIPFEKLWEVAEHLFKGAILGGEELGPLESCDYFDDKPEEFYIALYHAIRLNYPMVFSQVQKLLTKASGLLDTKEDSGLKQVMKMVTEQEE